MLYLPGLFGSQPESCCKFGIVWGSPSLHKVLHNSSVSLLHQRSFLHIISSCLVLMACGCEATHHAVSYPILYRFLNWPSLEHFIRSRQHIGRNREADLLGGFEIDDELKLRRLLYRKIGRLGAFEDLVHVSGGAAVRVNIAQAIGHEPPRCHFFCPFIYRREPALYSKFCNLCPARTEDGAWQPEKDCVSTPLSCGLECDLNILGTLDVHELKLHPKRPCGELGLF